MPKPIRRINSRTGTSGNRNAERVYQTTAAVHAHVITIETEGPMHYAVCSCRRFTSSRWAIEHRAALAGAAHQYAMSFPVVPALPDTTAPFQEAPVVFPHGSCYIHVDEQPCACLAGCVMCTGCLCSCDCLSRT